MISLLKKVSISLLVIGLTIQVSDPQDGLTFTTLSATDNYPSYSFENMSSPSGDGGDGFNAEAPELNAVYYSF